MLRIKEIEIVVRDAISSKKPMNVAYIYLRKSSSYFLPMNAGPKMISVALCSAKIVGLSEDKTLRKASERKFDELRSIWLETKDIWESLNNLEIKNMII
jgi:hypothetical protein